MMDLSAFAKLTLHGRGVAYARYIHSRFPGFGAAWAAWVVDLAVEAGTGRITIEKVVVGQDTGMMVNPDGVQVSRPPLRNADSGMREAVDRV